MKPEIGEKGMRGNCLLGFMVILRRKQNKCNYFEKLINLINFIFFCEYLIIWFIIMFYEEVIFIF
jgi:hypothetical protein